MSDFPTNPQKVYKGKLLFFGLFPGKFLSVVFKVEALKFGDVRHVKIGVKDYTKKAGEPLVFWCMLLA